MNFSPDIKTVQEWLHYNTVISYWSYFFLYLIVLGSLDVFLYIFTLDVV